MEKIIIKKNVDIKDLKAYFTAEDGLRQYNKHQYQEDELNEAEYNLVRVVFR